MLPYLLALSLNGMSSDKGKEILPIGQGELDLRVLRKIRDSGWQGPIGILSHTNEDAEARLSDNLEGLDWVAAQLDGGSAPKKPEPRSWRNPKN